MVYALALAIVLGQENAVRSVQVLTDRAVLGLGSTPLWETPAGPAQWEQQPDPQQRWTVYCRGAWALVDKPTGLVVVFSLHRPLNLGLTWPVNPLARAQIEDLAQQYASLAGFLGPVKVTHIDEERNDSVPYFDVSLLPTHDGVPFGMAPSSMQIEASQGVLLHFILRQPPSPPADLVPRVPASQARAVALAHLFSPTRPQPPRVLYSVVPPARVEETLPLRLYIWRPTPPGRGPEVYTTPEMGAMAERNEGLLVWSLGWADLDSYYSGLDTYVRRYRAWIDAKTGRLLSFEQFYPFGGGGGEAVRKAPFRWDLPASSIELSAGTRSAIVGDGAVLALGTKALPKDAMEIAVRVGRMVVNARFSPSTGLLYAQLDKGWAAGRPSPSLAAAARSLIRDGFRTVP